MVVDSSSIEVNRRARRAKTDRLDAAKLVAMLIRWHQGEEHVWSVVRVPSEEVEDSRRLHRELQVLKTEQTQHNNRQGKTTNIQDKEHADESISLLPKTTWSRRCRAGPWFDAWHHRFVDEALATRPHSLLVKRMGHQVTADPCRTDRRLWKQLKGWPPGRWQTRRASWPTKIENRRMFPHNPEGTFFHTPADMGKRSSRLAMTTRPLRNE